MSNSKKTGCGCLPLVGAVAVLGVGAGGVYYYLNGFGGQSFTPLQAAQVVPQEALAASYVSTDNKNWSQLQQFGTPEARQLISNNLQQFQTELTQNTKIDYQQDVAPWVGGVMMAFLPDATPSDGEASPLLVVGIKNKVKALEFAKKLQNQPGQTTTESDYQGVKITETTTPDGDQFNSAVLGDRLVLSSARKPVEMAIDTFKGQPSYANKEGVKPLLEKQLSLKNPLAQIYIDDYPAFVAQSGQIPSTGLAKIQQIQSVVVGVGAENEGLHLQAIATQAPDTPPSSLKPTTSDLLPYYPSDTVALISGQAISKGWSQVVEQSQTDPNLQNIIAQIRQNLRGANLDADREVFGWMDQHFSLGLMTVNPTGQVGGMMVIETSDRNTAEQTFNKLSQMARVIPFVQINQKPVKGTDLTEWTSPQQEVLLSYGWLKPNTAVVTLGTSFATIDTQSATSALPQSVDFQTITRGLPSPNLGYFYLDITKAQTILAQTPLVAALSPEANAMLNSMKGVGMTVTQSNPTTSQLDVMISLKLANTQ